jgi:hypothetical protein
MAIVTFDKAFTFDELKEQQQELFRKLNYCCGLTEYKVHKQQYDFTCSINAWRFDVFLSDAQWKALAQLCINYRADINEVIRGCHFDTEQVSVTDGFDISIYAVPTDLCGWVKNLYFSIDVDGRCNM